jgi:endonuclease/exonuclease/phosphatase (EEP) superfamily protein YafD
MTNSPSRRLALLTVFVLALTLGLGFATLSAVLGGLAWPLELFANFHPQWAALSLVLLLAALLLRHRPLIVVNAVLLAANIVPLAPHLMSYVRDPAPVEATGPTLRLLSLNMHVLATDDGKFQALVAAEQPDVILLTEAPFDLEQRMAPLAALYPYRIPPRDKLMHEVAVYSRWPIAGIETNRSAHPALPVSAIDLCPPSGARGACLRVVTLHAMTPFGAGAAIRERQFNIAARLATMQLGPAVIIGDMNLTPWSPTFARLIDSAHLRDTSRLRGLQPTWQSSRLPAGIAPLFALSIDQALVSEDIAPRANRIGPDVGSDHRPMIVDLQLPNLAAPRL